MTCFEQDKKHYLSYRDGQVIDKGDTVAINSPNSKQGDFWKISEASIAYNSDTNRIHSIILQASPLFDSEIASLRVSPSDLTLTKK